MDDNAIRMLVTEYHARLSILIAELEVRLDAAEARAARAEKQLIDVRESINGRQYINDMITRRTFPEIYDDLNRVDTILGVIPKPPGMP